MEILTYDPNVVGHPGESNPLFDKNFPGFWSKHLAAGQQHVELGQAAEEEGGQGGGEEGEVLAEQLLQGPAVFALKNLCGKCMYNMYKIHLNGMQQNGIIIKYPWVVVKLL